MHADVPMPNLNTNVASEEELEQCVEIRLVPGAERLKVPFPPTFKEVSTSLLFFPWMISYIYLVDFLLLV